MAQSVSEMLKESKTKKKQYLKWAIPVGILLIGGITYAFLPKGETNLPYVPEIYEVKKGDISSSVNSDGNIINPDIVNLSFLINGTLRELYVKEGAKVEAGQVLAELDKQDLNFDLKSAQNDVNISWQNIKSTESDITDLDIINAKNDFEVTQDKVKNSQLTAEQNYEITKNKAEATKKSAEQNLEQAFTDAKLTLEPTFSTVKEALTEINFTFGIEKNYNGETLTSVFNDSGREVTIKNLYNESLRDLEILKTEYEAKKYFMEQADISRMVLKAESLTQKVQNILDSAEKVFVTAQEGRGITQATISSKLGKIQSFKSQVESLNSQLSKAKQSIDTNFLNLQNTFLDIKNDLDSAKLNLDNTLRDTQSDIKSAELKINNAEKTTNKSNTSKEISLQIQYAQLEQAKLRVEKAKYELSLADLKAPKAGTIIEVNGNVGESLKGDTTSSETAFIKILSDANFTTEVYVEEIDIAQIEIGQKAEITLDAIPDAKLEGAVSYIASTATTDNNGIVTYLVRIDIKNSEDQPIREGMTTYVDFILGEAKDVVLIPNKALIRNRFVMLENNERVEVEVGFSDGSLIEVKSGLSVGDKIISNPVTEGEGNRGGRSGAASGEGRALTPERIEQMKSAGFTDDELEKLQKGEFTDDMRAKMQKMREENNQTGGGFGGGSGPRR